MREGKTRGLFKDRAVFTLLAGEPEYLDPLKDEAPVGWFVTGYPWYAIETPEHKASATPTRRSATTIRGSARSSATAPSWRSPRRSARPSSTDTEKLVAAHEGPARSTRRSGTVTYRALDHQSTMGAYVGTTAVKDGKG